MNQPLLNPSTRLNLESIIKNLPQSLIIHGQAGSGLTTIVNYIASQLKVKPLVFLPEKDGKINQSEGIIGVDIIRQLYEVTSAKTTTKRLIVIDRVETITKQAQNAFLKLLEEPSPNNHFILVTNNIDTLLPTIVSRAVKLEIKPLSNQQSNQILGDFGLKDSKKRQQLLFMADGRPAELSKLSSDEAYFNYQLDFITTSKNLLTANLYNKLLLIDKYKDNRQEILQILQYCLLILKQTISQNLKNNSLNHIEIILETYSQVKSNGNIKLLMTRMALHLV